MVSVALGIGPGMETFYVLVHRKHGAISTFLTVQEAKRELNQVLLEESEWSGDFTIEPVRETVATSTETG